MYYYYENKLVTTRKKILCAKYRVKFSLYCYNTILYKYMIVIGLKSKYLRFESTFCHTNIPMKVHCVITKIFPIMLWFYKNTHTCDFIARFWNQIPFNRTNVKLRKFNPYLLMIWMLDMTPSVVFIQYDCNEFISNSTFIINPQRRKENARENQTTLNFMYIKFHVNDTLTWNVFKALENISITEWFA